MEGEVLTENQSQVCRVLCVDDHPDTLNFYAFALKREGFQTTLASTTEEARQHFQEQTFDLFILDGLLGSHSGVSLCQEVRTCQPEAAILVISGQVRPQDREKALAAGANDFLPKPVGLDALWNTTRQLVEGKCSLDT